MNGKYDGYEIKVEMSEGGIFWPDGADKYNVSWSLDNLARAIQDKLVVEYPGAEIAIDLRSANDRNIITDPDGDIDEEHGHSVNGFVGQIWQDWDWADWAIECS